MKQGKLYQLGDYHIRIKKNLYYEFKSKMDSLLVLAAMTNFNVLVTINKHKNAVGVRFGKPESTFALGFSIDKELNIRSTTIMARTNDEIEEKFYEKYDSNKFTSRNNPIKVVEEAMKWI